MFEKEMERLKKEIRLGQISTIIVLKIRDVVVMMTTEEMMYLKELIDKHTKGWD